MLWIVKYNSAFLHHKYIWYGNEGTYFEKDYRKLKTGGVYNKLMGTRNQKGHI